MLAGLWVHSYQQVKPAVNRCAVAWADDGGGLFLLDDGRAGDFSASGQLVTMVHWAFDESVGVGEVGRTGAVESNAGIGVRLDDLLLKVQDGLRPRD